MIKPATSLIVTADDYGIGPATSHGILQLASARRVTASVLLVTSPYAEEAVRDWQRGDCPADLGWHPCLTLDQPIAPADCVRTLIDHEGRFWPLAQFPWRLATGRIAAVEIETELRAQYLRFVDLTGRCPAAVSFHHHLQVFAPLGDILRAVLAEQRPRPYVRRIREPWALFARVADARGKRLLLSLLGIRDAQRWQRAGFPGNDWLAGISRTTGPIAADFFSRWLIPMPGKIVELTCHPGMLDQSLIGRDCRFGDGRQEQRACEWELLKNPAFEEACRRAGFQLIRPSRLGDESFPATAEAA